MGNIGAFLFLVGVIGNDTGKKGAMRTCSGVRPKGAGGARPLTRGGGAPPSLSPLSPEGSRAGTDVADVGDDREVPI